MKGRGWNSDEIEKLFLQIEIRSWLRRDSQLWGSHLPLVPWENFEVTRFEIFKNPQVRELFISRIFPKIVKPSIFHFFLKQLSYQETG